MDNLSRVSYLHLKNEEHVIAKNMRTLLEHQTRNLVRKWVFQQRAILAEMRNDMKEFTENRSVRKVYKIHFQMI